MGPLRRIFDEADARRCLLAAKVAGLSSREWARSHGVDGRSLHAWKVNLARGTKSPRRDRRVPEARRLVELVPTAPSTHGASRYVLEFGGARIEFGDDISAATLRRVVDALRPC